MQIWATEKSSPTNPWQAKKFSASWLGFLRCFAHVMPMKDFRRSFKLLVGTSNIFLCFGHANLSNRKKFSNQPLAGKKVLCHMIGFVTMFCLFYARKGPQEVFQVAFGHFQYLSVLWTCKFEQLKKVLQPTLGRQKHSLPHDWVSQDILPILCPWRTSGGISSCLWALPIFFCSLDMWTWATEKSSPTNPWQAKKFSAGWMVVDQGTPTLSQLNHAGNAAFLTLLYYKLTQVVFQ